MKVTYHHNNSGGQWWLDDNDWKALERHGWTVEWFGNREDPYWSEISESGRFLGALASTASITVDSTDAEGVIESWEIITGQDAKALGCFSCCGPPHSFEIEYDNGQTVYVSPEPTNSALTGW